MIRSSSEVVIDEHGAVALPMSILAEAGSNPGETLLAFSEGDGRIVLRRLEDTITDLLNGRPL
ncbi:AbrB/MazE/SpoVT family DNA-binding domain-containing protein [Streptomyces ardesiacus]|uniref:AbrB/MazE/SpoVT family DNA-binding domain-containing protein n=1 Tax=Streptomyces ardesiacus TaxID=285564 RepID=UPI00201F4E2F|nr:AbrB/MazE/SpoVT family DNA-binding domain-containing protein [Streptomyces ardesiacus]MCL7365031.1 AbrB/MazE/SpoVT family DNA-binding domain-containing protein [Streptomyces ardesiacus]